MREAGADTLAPAPQTAAGRLRPKRRPLLLLLDEMAQLGRMAHFEKNMGAQAGYGIKLFLVCQSPNQIIGAYGRANTVIDNCAVIVAFAASDNESAKRIGEMAGEVWEERPQESEQRPRSLLGPRKGAVTYREERRPLLLAGDVRSLPRDEALIFVAGHKPIRAKKLQFDREPVFKARLYPAPRTQTPLTTVHDWEHVLAFGRLSKDRNGAVRVDQAPHADQGELFAAPMSISEQILAGLQAPRPPQTATPQPGDPGPSQHSIEETSTPPTPPARPRSLGV